MALSDAQMQQFLAAQQAQAKEQVLFTFNCGTMEMGRDKTVTADPRKGKAVLSMEDDGLLRFQWRLRHKDENEQQYFVFPKGATWVRIDDCKDGRVFLLKFRDSDVRRFFWLQEPKNDKSDKRDAEILRRVSSLLDNPPKFGAPLPKEEDEAGDSPMTDVSSVSVNGGGVAAVQGTGHAAAGVAATQEHRGAVAHPPATAATAAAVPAAAASTAGAAASGSSASSSSLNTNALLSTLNAMAQQLAERQAQAESGPKVEDVLDADRVQPILDADRALVDALVAFLPEGHRSPDDLRQQLRSPQMQQTMSRLTSILNSSQFGQLMASLSLPVSGQTGLGVDAFIAAIQAQAQKQQQEKK